MPISPGTVVAIHGLTDRTFRERDATIGFVSFIADMHDLAAAREEFLRCDTATTTMTGNGTGGSMDGNVSTATQPTSLSLDALAEVALAQEGQQAVATEPAVVKDRLPRNLELVNSADDVAPEAASASPSSSSSCSCSSSCSSSSSSSSSSSQDNDTQTTTLNYRTYGYPLHVSLGSAQHALSQATLAQQIPAISAEEREETIRDAGVFFNFAKMAHAEREREERTVVNGKGGVWKEGDEEMLDGNEEDEGGDTESDEADESGRREPGEDVHPEVEVEGEAEDEGEEPSEEEITAIMLRYQQEGKTAIPVYDAHGNVVRHADCRSALKGWAPGPPAQENAPLPAAAASRAPPGSGRRAARRQPARTKTGTAAAAPKGKAKANGKGKGKGKAKASSSATAPTPPSAPVTPSPAPAPPLTRRVTLRLTVNKPPSSSPPPSLAPAAPLSSSLLAHPSPAHPAPTTITTTPTPTPATPSASSLGKRRADGEPEPEAEAEAGAPEGVQKVSRSGRAIKKPRRG
ncbi:hypothetical protein MMC24_003150 [Lignoscripta atroalba]|nr:hypothetical protein [Lignoscripta atroalba]